MQTLDKKKCPSYKYLKKRCVNLQRGDFQSPDATRPGKTSKASATKNVDHVHDFRQWINFGEKNYRDTRNIQEMCRVYNSFSVGLTEAECQNV